MPLYQYKARDAQGKAYTGQLNCDSLPALYAALREREQYCVNARELYGGKIIKERQTPPRKLTIKQLAVFCRQLSTMISSGITVIKALDILTTQATSKNIHRITRNVLEKVQTGDTLSLAMAKQSPAFPDLLLSMVEAGELSGSLDTALTRMAEHFEKERKLRNKITSSMMYPAILTGLCILVVIFLMVVVMPTFISLFQSLDAQLPLPTRILIGLSRSLTHFWYLYLLAAAIIATLLTLFLHSEKGRLAYDRFKVSVPIFGKLNKTLLTARFARSLSTLFSSGVELIQSLEMSGKIIKNAYMNHYIDIIRDQVSKGVSLSTAVNRQNIFPVMFCQMIGIGEESGALDELLLRTAAYYEDESDAALQKMVALIEPLMIIVLALVIGFVLISIMLPTFTMMQSIH